MTTKSYFDELSEKSYFKQIFNDFFHDKSNATETDRYYADNFSYASKTFEDDMNFYQDSSFIKDNEF
ncbi:MAG: hypothetical protein V4525_06790 [Pseudomonadota bacterium]